MTQIINHKQLHSVYAERLAQDRKWGPGQSHPDGTGNPVFKMQADIARDAADTAARDGNITWRHILREEFFEALAESDIDRLREELVQVAAVAVSWIEDLDRRTDDGSGT